MSSSRNTLSTSKTWTFNPANSCSTSILSFRTDHLSRFGRIFSCLRKVAPNLTRAGRNTGEVVCGQPCGEPSIDLNWRCDHFCGEAAVEAMRKTAMVPGGHLKLDTQTMIDWAEPQVKCPGHDKMRQTEELFGRRAHFRDEAMQGEHHRQLLCRASPSLLIRDWTVIR